MKTKHLRQLIIIATLMFYSSTAISQMPQTYDASGVRYTLVGETTDSQINWLFLPGGPGADSRYMLSLIQILQLPGKVWLVDLPGAGDNPTPENYDFNRWLYLLPGIVARFDNCVLVGHSFGGILPLLSPQLEDKLRGLVIINSTPSLWVEASAKLYKKHNIPDLPEKQAFFNDRTQENYNKLLKAYLPYYFNKEALPKGYEMFDNLPFPVNTMWKVYGMMLEIKYNARWIPQKVPTLIIGGNQDYINPFSLFEKDKRFNRKNIQKALIKDCGHWCWIEKPDEVNKLFTQFTQKHLSGL